MAPSIKTEEHESRQQHWVTWVFSSCCRLSRTQRCCPGGAAAKSAAIGTSQGPPLKPEKVGVPGLAPHDSRGNRRVVRIAYGPRSSRSEEHTSELQSLRH